MGPGNAGTEVAIHAACATATVSLRILCVLRGEDLALMTVILMTWKC